MNKTYNKHIVVGYMAKDALLDFRVDFPRSEFSVGTIREYFDQSGEYVSQWENVRVELKGKLAEKATKTWEQGDLVRVEGRVVNYKWTDTGGATKFGTKTVGDNISRLESKANKIDDFPSLVSDLGDTADWPI